MVIAFHFDLSDMIWINGLVYEVSTFMVENLFASTGILIAGSRVFFLSEYRTAQI